MKECAVCEKNKRRDNMQFLEPINDWICDNCLRKGREEGVSSVEEGREFTKNIRGEN